MPLLRSDDFDDLPNGPEARWLAIRDIVEERLELRFNRKNDEYLVGDILEYSSILTASSEELGLEAIESIDPGNAKEDFDWFRSIVAAFATRMCLRVSNEQDRVQLSEIAKEKIRGLVAKIQGSIPQLELTERQEVRLKRALSSFSEELDLPRSRFSFGSGHLVAALTVLNLGVTTTASGPDAVDAIKQVQSIWGEEYEREKSMRLKLPYDPPLDLLSPPPKLISGPQSEEGG